MTPCTSPGTVPLVRSESGSALSELIAVEVGLSFFWLELEVSRPEAVK